MSDNIKRGNEGEERAANFLTEKGYEILDRNYRFKRSEIDLVVRKDNVLVFVEVKMRSSASHGFPEEFVDRAKQLKVLEGAEQYMMENQWHGRVRYDVVSVQGRGADSDVRHFEDAFY
ncbi:MAG: YraN family protein [Flammeovirgaceae bacterium]|nr:YraN family protein [Flammeovirgaceae bacterium]